MLEEKGEVLLGPKNQSETHELKDIWKINSARNFHLPFSEDGGVLARVLQIVFVCKVRMGIPNRFLYKP